MAIQCENEKESNVKDNVSINHSDANFLLSNKTSENDYVINNKQNKKGLHSFQENSDNIFLLFKDSVRNNDQFYLAKYINELSLKKEWLSFIKNASSALSEFELQELIFAIFLSDIEVFTIEIKQLLNECVKRYPNTELSDVASGYLILY